MHHATICKYSELGTQATDMLQKICHNIHKPSLTKWSHRKPTKNC